MVSAPELTICASGSSAPAGGQNIVCWDKPPDHAGCRSLIDYIEANAEEIRQNYLAWAHELGDVEIGGRKLRHHFRLGDGPDLWAQSVFVEQSPWKQPSIETLLRLLAIERILETERPSSLAFVGNDSDLRVIVRRLCARRGIAFEWRAVGRALGNDRARWSPQLKRAIQLLPHATQGAIALAYLMLTRLRLARPRQLEGPGNRRRVAICGPLFNLDTDETGTFISRFWTRLPGVLRDAGVDVLWLHHFYAHKEIPDVRVARARIGSLNRAATGGEIHRLLDEYFSLRGALSVMWRWLGVSVRSLYLGQALRRRSVAAVGESFWPVIRHDWAKAFRGVGAIESLFYAECFDRAIECLPRQSECIYLMENQGWERSLARAWRKHFPSRLTGVPHTSIRFWDLRYHCDPRRYDAESRLDVPGPDSVVLNGSAMTEAYFATASRREATVCCEALRYLHLLPSSAERERAQKGPTAFRILVLGDYFSAATSAMLHFLEHCRDALGPESEIWFKSHPNAPIDANEFPQLALKLCEEPVASLVPQVSLVLAGGSTTAALDAYITGGTLAVYNDGSTLNYSPVRGLPGVRYVRDAVEIEKVVSAIRRGAVADLRAEEDLLIIDPALPRWRRYFGILQ